MHVLSIDVGWKHLAYCFLEKKDKDTKIIQWEIINLCSEDVNVNKLSIDLLIETCKIGIEKFVHEKSNQLKNYEDVEIFIESQPMGPFTKNIKTKILSHLLQYLFYTFNDNQQVKKNLSILFINFNY